MNTLVKVASVASALPVAAPSLVSDVAALSIDPRSSNAGSNPVVAADPGEIELRALWEMYQIKVAEFEVAAAAYRQAREPYEVERAELSKRFDAGELTWSQLHAETDLLFQKHGLRPWCAAARESCDVLSIIVEKIHAIPAETLYGIGVKLAARSSIDTTFFDPDESDFGENVRAVLPDVDRAAGSNFTAFVLDDDEDDESEAKVEEPKPLGAVDAPLYKAIEKHTKTSAHLEAILREKSLIDKAWFDADKKHTPETRRQMRNVDRRIDRAHDSERTAWEAILQSRPKTALGQSTMIAYIRSEYEREGFRNEEHYGMLLDSVYEMVTPKWLERMREVAASKVAA